MQVHYDEGVAIYIDPEPCVGVREDGDEASVGEGIGQPLSRESLLVPGADAVSNAEGNTNRRNIASVWSTRRGRRTWHVQKGRSHDWPVVAYGTGPHREGEEP